MDPVIIYLLILISFLIPIFGKNYINKESKSFDNFYHKLSKYIDMEYIGGSFFKKSYLIKKDDYYKIIINRKLKLGIEYLKITITYKVKYNNKYEISNETISSKAKRTIGVDDILTHDKTFDDKILIKSSDKPYIISILNGVMRKNIMYIATDNIFNLTNKKLIVYTSSFNIPTVTKIKNSMERIVEFIYSHEGIEKQLITNIKKDPDKNVKLNNIKTYLSHYQYNDIIESSLKKLLSTKNYDVQINAALLLKNKGLNYLLGFIKKNSDIEDQYLVRIIQAFEKYKFISSIDELKKIFISNKNKNIKIQILLTFQTLHDKSISNFLIHELGKNDSKVELKIIETLGQCGSIEIIEHLYKLREKSHSPSYRQGINDAMSKIQSRLGPVESGWLSNSITSKKEGALSIDNEAGKGSLSIDED